MIYTGKNSFEEVGGGDVFAFTLKRDTDARESYYIAYARFTRRDDSIRYTVLYHKGLVSSGSIDMMLKDPDRSVDQYTFKGVLFKGTGSTWKTRAKFHEKFPEYSI